MKNNTEKFTYFVTVMFWTILGLILGLVIYWTLAPRSLVQTEFVTGGTFYVGAMIVEPIILARRA